MTAHSPDGRTGPARGTVRPRPAYAFAPLFAALAFVMPFLGSLIGSTALGDTTYPSPFAQNADILHYFAHNHDAVVLQSLLQSFSAVGLLVLAAQLAAAASTADDRALHPRLIAVAGGFAAAFQLVSALLGWVAVRDATQANSALVRALHDLSFLTGGTGAVLGVGLMIGVTALALPAALPPWIRAAGLILLAMAVLSLLCLVAEPAAFLLPVARFLGMAWLLLVTVLVSRGRRGPSGEPAVRPGGGRGTYLRGGPARAAGGPPVGPAPCRGRDSAARAAAQAERLVRFMRPDRSSPYLAGAGGDALAAVPGPAPAVYQEHVDALDRQRVILTALVGALAGG